MDDRILKQRGSPGPDIGPEATCRILVYRTDVFPHEWRECAETRDGNYFETVAAASDFAKSEVGPPWRVQQWIDVRENQDAGFWMDAEHCWNPIDHRPPEPTYRFVYSSSFREGETTEYFNTYDDLWTFAHDHDFVGKMQKLATEWREVRDSDPETTSRGTFKPA